MGASDSKDQSSNGTDDSRRRSDENSSQTSATSVAVAGAVGAAVGAGLLAWSRSRAAAAQPDHDPRTLVHYGDDGGHCSPPGRRIEVLRRPPATVVWKVNTDGSHVQGSHGGVGVLIRDETGDPIVAFVCAYPEEDVLTHELQAILRGLLLADDQRRKRNIMLLEIELFSDNTSAVDIANYSDQCMDNKIKAKRQIDRDLAKEIRAAKQKFDSCAITHIPNGANKAADHFAGLCKDVWEERTLYPHEFSRRAWDLIEEDAKLLN